MSVLAPLHPFSQLTWKSVQTGVVPRERWEAVHLVRRQQAARGACSTASWEHPAWGALTRAQLIREDRPSQPVAAYHKEKRFMHLLRISQYPYLEVDKSSTADVLDQLIRECPNHRPAYVSY